MAQHHAKIGLEKHHEKLFNITNSVSDHYKIMFLGDFQPTTANSNWTIYDFVI